VLYAFYNVPWPYMLAHMAVIALNSLRAAAKAGCARASLLGLGLALGTMVRDSSSRRPVSRRIYRLIRRLRNSGPIPLSEIESALPPIASAKQGRFVAPSRRF